MADNRVVVIQKRVPSLTSTAEIAKILNGEKFITVDTSMEYYKHEVSGEIIPFGGKDVGNLKPTVDGNKVITDDNELALAIESIRGMMDSIESYDDFQVIYERISVIAADLASLPKNEFFTEINTKLATIISEFSGKHEPGKIFSYSLTNQIEASSMMDASTFEYLAEMFRTMGQSGIISTRSYGVNGNRPWTRSHDVSYAALNMHDHPNFYNLPGTAEVSACLNGYYVRTRHNDYGLVQPALAGPTHVFNSTEAIPPPDIPPSVLAKVTLDEKLQEMREYFIAYSTQNIAHRDYRPYFTWTFSYFELWLEVFDENVEDPFTSLRHALASKDARKLLEMALYFNYGGHKNRAENLAYMNRMLRYVDATGTPQFATIKWRICAVPAGNVGTIPPTNFKPINDTRTNRRFNTDYLSDAHAKSRRARFRLTANGTDEPTNFSSPQLIDQLMATVPGKDGRGAVLNEVYKLYGADDVTLKWNGSSTVNDKLNIANYNRYYYMAGNDASGRSSASRGFNDPTLWVAMTTNPKVVGVPSDSGVLRFTYAVPFEMILHTPLENEAWNPYNIPLKTTSMLAIEAAQQGGANNSKPKVYTGYNGSGYFHLTPAAFFSGTSTNDPADTDSPITVKFPDNLTVAVANSGTRAFLPTIPGVVGQIRQRYPIYPAYYEGSHAEGGIEILNEQVTDLKTKLADLTTKVNGFHP